MTRLRTAWAVAPLALLMACGSGADDDGMLCHTVGAPSGISVVVEPELAPKVRVARATVCWEHCVAGRVGLMRVDAEGTRRGFIPVAGLPAEEVEVTAVLQRLNGTEVSRFVARTTPQTRYPNGKECGAAGNQGGVTLP